MKIFNVFLLISSLITCGLLFLLAHLYVLNRIQKDFFFLEKAAQEYTTLYMVIHFSDKSSWEKKEQLAHRALKSLREQPESMGSELKLFLNCLTHTLREFIAKKRLPEGAITPMELNKEIEKLQYDMKKSPWSFFWTRNLPHFKNRYCRQRSF